MGKIEKKIQELLEPTVQELGYRLYGVQYGKEGSEMVLDIIIDNDAGIGLDDCEKVSRAVEPILDETDPITGSYMLSVSSPGADRPVVSEEDFLRNIDKPIEIRLYKAFQGKSKHRGKLLAFDEEHITILDRNKKITIPREIVSLVKQDIDFS